MTNMIPLAGLGSRFATEGYVTPKPLIQVSGKEMIIQAALCAPKDDDWVFLCRKEHIEDFNIDKILKDAFPMAKIISIDKTTEGQACTCLLGKDVIAMDEPLFIGACDNGMVWDKEEYTRTLDGGADLIVWTFSEKASLKTNPKAWGWVDTDGDQNVKNVSVKVPISDDPYHDQAVIGAFTFRSGNVFVDIVNELIRKNIRVNNEFYLDSCANVALDMGLKVKAFKTRHYIGWGTPNDLKTYEYWESYFDKAPTHPFKRY